MAVPGRQPGPEGQRRHRNKSEVEWAEYPNVPYRGDRPKLPIKRTIMTRFGPDQITLQALTKQWWKTISSMPQCVAWTESDWLFAVSTALVADAAYCGIASAAVELRNREKVLGTTAEFRRGLRIRYVEAASEGKPAEVTHLDDYRDL